MSLKIYLDGKIVDEENAKISVFDHGLLYGDGIFEGIRAYNGHVFRLEEHIDRLFEGCHIIQMKPKETKQEMTQAVIDTCKVNNIKDGYIRLVVSRGKGDMGLNPKSCAVTTTFCIAGNINLYPAEFYQKGLTVATVAIRRNSTEACNPGVKSLNYLNNIYARLEADLLNVPEAIMINAEGYPVEATADNLFIVRDGVLMTPPTSSGILNGITRRVVMRLAAKRGIPVQEKLFTRAEAYTAQEFFLSGTAAELVPVTTYDGRKIGTGVPGEIYKTIAADFKAFTQIDGPEIK